jgi:hypothetical protein
MDLHRSIKLCLGTKQGPCLKLSFGKKLTPCRVDAVEIEVKQQEINLYVNESGENAFAILTSLEMIIRIDKRDTLERRLRSHSQIFVEVFFKPSYFFA